MGIYVNPGNARFQYSLKSKFFVDKSNLLRLTNDALGTEDRRIVVSRPRRFGKTFALGMMTAYYSCGCGSRDLFHGLAIENDTSFEEHLNKHNVITMDLQAFYDKAVSINRLDDFPFFISETINAELAKLYPDEVQGHESFLADSILQIHAVHGASFIFLVDEWDVIYREQKYNENLKNSYTRFLRGLFKDAIVSECIELVYMTGILPIPKHEAQSGLNNFREYTMLKPRMFAEYFGFTEAEVSSLCQKHQMPLQELKNWYEGYQFDTVGSMYCPNSVVQALREHDVGSYWSQTGSATQLLDLMNNVEDSFQDKVKELLAGKAAPVSIDRDGIDLSDVNRLDTALTALVHLGYLAYREGKVYIPNLEVASEFLNVLSKAENNPAYRIIAHTKDLLEKTLKHDADAVARILEDNHNMYSSVLTYNQESDLACIIIASYKGLVEDSYMFTRELPAGKGFADIVFLPIKPGKIPIIIELKWDQSADTAIRQIKERRYTGIVRGYPSVLLVGISYEKDPNKSGYKEHNCVIEQIDNP